MALEQPAQTIPPESARLAASGEPFLPYPLNLMGVPSQSTTIACDAIVGVMAPHHLAQVALLLGDPLMQIMSAPIAYRCQRAGEAVLRRALAHHTLPLSRLDPDMGKAKEVECGPTCRRVGLAIGPFEAEIDKACLVRMQHEAVSCKTLAQNSQRSLGTEEILKSHHEIVGVSNKDTSPFQPWPHHCLEPIIQHMMQKDVR